MANTSSTLTNAENAANVLIRCSFRISRISKIEKQYRKIPTMSCSVRSTMKNKSHNRNRKLLTLAIPEKTWMLRWEASSFVASNRAYASLRSSFVGFFFSVGTFTHLDPLFELLLCYGSAHDRRVYPKF